MSGMTRRQVLKAASAAITSLVVASESRSGTDDGPGMRTRPIPHSGELLPVIGCGTYRTFDVGSTPGERTLLAAVLQVLFAAGGSVIDTSPMYGAAEHVVGDLLTQGKARSHAFLATKVWTSGRRAGEEQIRRSFELLQDRRIDLVQVHNLLDWRSQLPMLRELKAQGRIRYIGVTHYSSSSYDELEAVLRTETLDFVQINYAMDDTLAQDRILPTAADRGVAVIVNQPFGGGGSLRTLLGRPLPPWAGEIDCRSWAQILLKFVLGHPAVTCVIPGTARPEHMSDNVRAGFGRFPDAALRDRMVTSLLG
jgi:diketogulonate reductase-like aldo/keto reductase